MLSLIRAFVPNKKPDSFERQLKFEAEGAAAAQEGKTREDCPYEDHSSLEWNHWVYGNENEQGKMIREFMDRDGTPRFYMTTVGTADELEGLREYSEKCASAEKRMRKERGWASK